MPVFTIIPFAQKQHNPAKKAGFFQFPVIFRKMLISAPGIRIFVWIKTAFHIEVFSLVLPAFSRLVVFLAQTTFPLFSNMPAC